MDQNQTPSSKQQPINPEKPGRWQKAALFALGVILLLSVAGYGVYAWQQQEVMQLKAEIEDLEEEAAQREETIGLQEDSVTAEVEDESLSSNGVIDLRENRVDLISVGDLSQLPKETPASFKAYLVQKLENNQPHGDNCINMYSVAQISNVNAAGQVRGVSADDHQERCGPGAGIVWYAVGGGWSSIAAHNPLSCEKVKTALIYKEFTDTCMEGAEVKENPNGALADKAAEY